MNKVNGWQTSAFIIAILGFVCGIILGFNISTINGNFNWIIMVSCWAGTFILYLFIDGIGTLIEQNDIIIELLKDTIE